MAVADLMDVAESDKSGRGRWQVLTLSTIAFTLLFSVWLMLGVLNIPMQKSLGLSDSQVDWLIAAAILAGALPRMMFGIWADRFGGRVVFLGLLLFCAVPTYLLRPVDDLPGVARVRPPVRGRRERVHRRDLVELRLVPAQP